MLATLKHTLEDDCQGAAAAPDADVEILCHLSSHMAHMGTWKGRLDLAHRILSLQVRTQHCVACWYPLCALLSFHDPAFALLCKHLLTR
jgi:hypothetical protein